MSHFFEFIAEVLLSGCGPRKDSPVLTSFLVLAMAIAGIGFLVFAGIAAAQMDVPGILAALLLIALSAVCFWLVRRGPRR